MVRAKTDVSQLNGASSLDEDDKFIVNQIDSGKPVTRTSTLKDLKELLNVTVSPNPPTGPSEGDLWFDDTTGILYVYYDDGDSQQWVSINDGNGGSSAAISINPPSDASPGDFWLDSETGILYVYYSSQWIST